MFIMIWKHNILSMLIFGRSIKSPETQVVQKPNWTSGHQSEILFARIEALMYSPTKEVSSVGVLSETGGDTVRRDIFLAEVPKSTPGALVVLAGHLYCNCTTEEKTPAQQSSLYCISLCNRTSFEIHSLFLSSLQIGEEPITSIDMLDHVCIIVG